ncbi:CD3337/EF1877 family mobilome membrane protein [Shouchella sp. JSM 1781072]|uniref:CD3337/EF1877 family mobilome membrane protein n=1 Tax=Shouchella sp. JSM 1781072 TaxID=3344581 RepID=UPI0035C14D56
MNWKQKAIWISIGAVLIALLFFGSHTLVFANDQENMTEPKIEEKGGVELSIKRFPISRYVANNEDADGRIKGAFVGFTNVIFSLAGNVVLVVDTAMDKLYSLEPIDEFADTLTIISTTVYDTLKEHFGELLFIFAVGYIVYLFIAKGSVQEALRRSVLFFLVLVVGGYWMLNAGYFMKSLNTLSVEAQGYMLEAGNGLINVAEGEGVYADTNQIDPENKMDGTIAIMRNVYFDLAMKKPYLIVNYGTTSENAINENDHAEPEEVPGGSNFNRVDRLLAFQLTSDGESDRQGYVGGEIDQYNNENMGGGNVFQQMGQSLIALIGSILLGIPFLLLALLNFLLQLIALALAFFIPFAFVMSYIPQLAYSGFVSIGKLLSVFVLKAMLGILILFVYVLCFIVDSVLPPEGFAMYLVNLTVLVAVLLLMIWKRDALIKMVTAGKVTSVDNNMLNQVRNEMVNPAVNAIRPRTAGLRESPIQQTEHQSPPKSERTSVKEGRKEAQLAEARTPQTDGKLESPSSAVAHNDQIKRAERTPQQKREEKKAEKRKKSTEKQASKQEQKEQKQPREDLSSVAAHQKDERHAPRQEINQRENERTKQPQPRGKQEQSNRTSIKQGDVTYLDDHRALRSVEKTERDNQLRQTKGGITANQRTEQKPSQNNPQWIQNKENQAVHPTKKVNERHDQPKTEPIRTAQHNEKRELEAIEKEEDRHTRRAKGASK